MAKKINSKHGLDRKQEIQARRLRVKLEQGDKDAIEEYHKIYVEWRQTNEGLFLKFLKQRDVVLYSAYIRINDKIKLREISERIMCNTTMVTEG